jgi:hypothetical protein
VNKFFLLVYIILFRNTLLFGGFSDLTLSSNTHDISNSFKLMNINISWNRPSETDSDVLNGYYYTLDKANRTFVNENNNKLDNTVTTNTFTASSGDGDYYFHIAPFANNGNIGATAHFGPIKIDTISPSEPIVSPDGGSHSTSKSISISSSDTNTYKIYYTLNNTTPTSSSTLYSGEIEISSTKILQAISIDGAGNKSPIKISNFTFNTSSNIARFGNEISINDTIATNPNGGSSSFKEYLSVQGDGVTHYKVKFNQQTFSARKEISTNIDLKSLSDGLNTVYIIGSSDGTTFQNENTANSLSFTIDNTAPKNVVFSPSGGEITSSTTISLSSIDSSSIYYTKDGGLPNNTKIQSSSIVLTSANNGTFTLKAIAYDLAGNKSNIKTEVYNVNIVSASSGGSSGGSGGGGGGGGGGGISSPSLAPTISIDKSLKSKIITNKNGKRVTSVTVGKTNIQTYINDNGNRVSFIKFNKGKTTNITSSILGSKTNIAKDGTFTISTPSIISESKKIFKLNISISPNGTISGTLLTTQKNDKNKSVSISSNIPNYSAGSIFIIEQKGNNIILNVVAKITNKIIF